MLFSYSAKSKTGEIVESVLEAADRFALSRDLRSRGLTPISVVEKGKNFNDKFSDFTSNLFSKVKLADQILFTKNLSGMLRAGLSLSRAISVLKKQTKNKKFYGILVAFSNEINAGGTLSSGLSKFPNTFSKLFVSMTRAGEESGNLAGALSEVGANIEKSHSLKKNKRSAYLSRSDSFRDGGNRNPNVRFRGTNFGKNF